jgi:hypothetical protein
MTPKLLLRIAAGVVLFFALGHSMGHFTRKNLSTPEAKTVYRVMEEFKFPIGSQMRSYDEFYEGMSLNLIITLLTITALLWVMSNISSQHPKIGIQILWPLLFCLSAFSATGFLYFFTLPALTCFIAGILILVTIFRLSKTAG